METLAKKRPPSGTLIAWIFIIFAILMILGGGMGLIVYSFMQQAGGMPQVPDDAPGLFRIMQVIFQNFGLLAFLQIIFAIFILIAGIQFLKLRAWARTALESVSWLSLLFTVGFGIFWIISWMNMTSSMPVPEGTPRPPEMFNFLGAVMGIIAVIVWAIPLIVIIKGLRGKTIKEAMLQR